MINVSSSSHFDMEEGLCFYAASKTFNFTLSEIMRKDYGTFLDVLTVVPRNVTTNLNTGRYIFSIPAKTHV